MKPTKVRQTFEILSKNIKSITFPGIRSPISGKTNLAYKTCLLNAQGKIYEYLIKEKIEKELEKHNKISTIDDVACIINRVRQIDEGWCAILRQKIGGPSATGIEELLKKKTYEGIFRGKSHWKMIYNNRLFLEWSKRKIVIRTKVMWSVRR